MNVRLLSAAVLLAAAAATASAGPLDPNDYRISDAGGNPADKANDGKKEEAKEPGKTDGVVVEEKRERPSESELVGPYNQAAWTLHRRFGTVRAYIQTEPGKVEFEQWIEYRVKKGIHNHDEVRFQEELEIGLPYRFQLDLYLMSEHTRDGVNSDFHWRGLAAEIRWAPFNWNVLFCNPTLYFEYMVLNNEPDTIEPKLLFSGDIVPRLHWGLNFIYEGTATGSRHHSEQADEWACHGGLAYGVVDNVFSVGIEADYVYTREGTRNPTTVTRFQEFFVGPSIQWRPMDQMHIDLAVLPNVAPDKEGKRAKIFFIFGYEF